jgi:hypothetical protein
LVVTPCRVVGGFHRFGWPCFRHLRAEDGGSIETQPRILGLQ